MILASITLSSNRSKVIGDALRSVCGWTDRCIIVDLGVTDDTLEVARSIVGDRLHVVPYDCSHEVGATGARNFGLAEAERLGADWAITLDTDERMNFDGIDIKGMLSDLDGVVLVPHDSGMYSKERFFKLPLADVFVGGVHECVLPKNGKQVLVQGISFSELEKSPEELKHKLEWLVDSLSKDVADNPTHPRSWYYLGDSHAALEHWAEAAEAFKRCADLNGWDEESAWSCFRLAVCLERMGKGHEAIAACALGLTKHSGIAELCWFAGEVSVRMGMADKAIYWARLAVANGINDGERHFLRPRIGFRYPVGLREGPYDLMARAYGVMGMKEEAMKANEFVQQLQGGVHV
jgi:hypothetical protein